MENGEMDALLTQWTATRSVVDRQDPLWELLSYRFARFALDMAREDAASLAGLHFDIAEQLLRATSSISANIGEGYSRPTFADRRRFYGYALGSAREAAAWYAALEGSALPRETVERRVAVLGRVRRLLFGMLSAAQKRKGAPPFSR